MKNLHRFFFYLVILFLPTQLGRHFWPTWSSVLGRNIDYLSPTVYLTDLIILGTLLSWCIESFFRRIRNHELRIMENANKKRVFLLTLIPDSKFIILFGLFALINIVVSMNKPVALYSWLKVLEFTLFGYYIIKTKPSVSLITSLLSLSILYSSIIAIVQFAVQHSIGGLLWFLGERTFTNQTPGIAQINWCFPNWTQCRLSLRPYATFPHPNVLGGFLAATLPLVIIQLSNNQIIKSSNRKKIFYILTIILGIIALLLTFSRSAIIIGLIGVAIAGITNYAMPAGRQDLRITRSKKILITTIGILFFLSLIAYYLSPLDPASESIVVRQQLNVAAISMWKNAPLFGVGLGNFLITLPQILPSRAVYFLQPVHNIYLLVLSETGLIGFIIFVLFLWWVIRDTRYVIRKTQTFSHISHLTSHISLISLLFLGLIDHYPLTLQQGQLLFALFLGLSLRYHRQ